MKKCIDYINEALEKDAFQEAYGLSKKNIDDLDACTTKLDFILRVLKTKQLMTAIKAEDPKLAEELETLKPLILKAIVKIDNMIDTLSSM